jgi:hypothetical protein
MKSEVYTLKVDTPDKLIARILDADACVKKCEDHFRWTTRVILTRVAMCTEFDGGISERLLWTVTNLLLLC